MGKISDSVNGEQSLRKCVWIENEMNDMNMTALTLCACDLKEGLDRSRLAHAWKLCQQRHPNLRTNIINDCVCEAKHNSLPIFIDNGNVDDLFVQYTNEVVCLNRDPAPNDLIVIINDNRMYIMIRMLHSLTDGTSLSIIINDLLTFYDTNPLQVESLPFLMDPLTIEDPNGRLKESVEYKNEVTKYYAERKQFTVLMPFDRSEYYPSHSTTSGIIRAQGTPGGLKNLLRECRSSGLTIGAVLMATVTFALGKIRKSSDLDTFSFDVEVNLRDRFTNKLGTDHVGCLIGGFPMAPKPAPHETLWDLAKNLREKTMNNIDRKLHFIYSIIYGEFPWEAEEFQQLEDDNHGFSDTLNFSNIGVYPFKTNYKLCSLVEQYTSGARWIPWFGAYALLFNSVNELCFTMMYPDVSSMNADYAKTFLDDVIYVTENISTMKHQTLEQYVDK